LRDEFGREYEVVLSKGVWFGWI